MPENPYPLLDAEFSGPEKIRLFVSRENERRRIKELLVELENRRLQTPLLHFFGPAGIGKTSLLTVARMDAKDMSVRFASVDIDSDYFGAETAPSELLWRLRWALRKAKVPTPLFDVYYSYLFSKYILLGVSLSLPGLVQSIAERSELFDKTLSTLSDKDTDEQAAALFDADFLKKIGTGVGGTLDNLKGAVLLTQLAKVFQDSHRDRRLKGEEIDIERMPRSELENVGSQILAIDLVTATTKSPILVAVDGFDRIQKALGPLETAPPAESGFEALVRFVMYHKSESARKSIGFLTIGREQLRWEEIFDTPTTTDKWSTHITQIPLPGLDRNAAANFLHRADGLLDKQGKADAAAALRASTEPILVAAREREVQADGGPLEWLYSPFRLRLCVEEVSLHGRSFTEADAASHAKDVCDAFLHRISGPDLNLISAVAMLGELDPSLFSLLVHKQIVAGISIADYDKTIRREAIFTSSGRAESYRLHFQLESAALELLHAPARSAFVTTVVGAILDAGLALATPDDFQKLTYGHLNAYRTAMRFLFRFYGRHLVAIDVFAREFLNLEELFHFDSELGAAARQPVFDELFERFATWTAQDGRQLVESELTSRSGKRARMLIKLIMAHMLSQTVTEEARLKAKATLTLLYRENVLPPRDAVLANAEELSALQQMKVMTEAEVLRKSGQFSAAKDALLSLLNSLPATLNGEFRARTEGDIYHELARCETGAGNSESAEDYFNQAFERWDKGHLSGRELAIRKLDFCQWLASTTGRHLAAKAILEKITPEIEASYPALHPRLGDLAWCWGIVHMRLGSFDQTKHFLARAVEIHAKNYGEDSPKVKKEKALLESITTLEARNDNSVAGYNSELSEATREYQIGPGNPRTRSSYAVALFNASNACGKDNANNRMQLTAELRNLNSLFPKDTEVARVLILQISCFLNDCEINDSTQMKSWLEEARSVQEQTGDPTASEAYAAALVGLLARARREPGLDGNLRDWIRQYLRTQCEAHRDSSDMQQMLQLLDRGVL